jgi:hypothetical protein
MGTSPAAYFTRREGLETEQPLPRQPLTQPTLCNNGWTVAGQADWAAA